MKENARKLVMNTEVTTYQGLQRKLGPTLFYMFREQLMDEEA